MTIDSQKSSESKLNPGLAEPIHAAPHTYFNLKFAALISRVLLYGVFGGITANRHALRVEVESQVEYFDWKIHSKKLYALKGWAVKKDFQTGRNSSLPQLICGQSHRQSGPQPRPLRSFHIYAAPSPGMP